MFRCYLPIDEEEVSELLFEIEELILLLDEIKQTTSSDYKILIEDAIDIFKRYSIDKRFVRFCNEGYLAIKADVE